VVLPAASRVFPAAKPDLPLRYSKEREDKAQTSNTATETRAAGGGAVAKRAAWG